MHPILFIKSKGFNFIPHGIGVELFLLVDVLSRKETWKNDKAS